MDLTAVHVPPSRSIRDYLAKQLREYGLLVALIAVMVFFRFTTDGTLLRQVNLTNPLLQGSHIVLMALGMVIVIVAGRIDLWVGSLMGAVGALAAALIVWMGIRRRTSNRAQGEEREPMAFFVLRNLSVTAALIFITCNLASFRGPMNVLITMGILTIIYAFVTESTVIGRQIQAAGGNEKAAKLSGINSERIIFLAFPNLGLLAAAAGLVFAARLNVYNTSKRA